MSLGRRILVTKVLGKWKTHVGGALEDPGPGVGLSVHDGPGDWVLLVGLEQVARFPMPCRDARVQGFVLEKNGSLYKLMQNAPDPVQISPIGPTEDKLESDFFQPIGKKLFMDMENTGS